MTTEVISDSVSPEALFDAATRLPPEELDRLTVRLLSLKQERRPREPHLTAQESSMMQVINEGLSQAERQRFDALIDLRQAEQLDVQQHAELLWLVEKSEMLDAKRLAALAELAKLRHCGLDELMNQLGLTPPEVR